MAALYKTLFSLNIEHEFFNKTQLSVDVLPSPETQVLFQDLSAIFRETDKGFVVAIHSTDDRPSKTLSAGTCFRFYLNIKDIRFNNVTGGIQASPSKILYFSNVGSRELTEGVFISAPIAEYTSTLAYEPGDLAVNVLGEAYESLKSNPAGGGSKNLGNTAYWKPLTTGRAFSSPADQVPHISNVLPIKFAPEVSAATYKVLKMNAQTRAFDILGLPEQTLEFDLPTTEASLPLDSLPKGLYKVLVNATDEYLFYKDELSAKYNYDAVLEIYHEPSLAEGAKLLDNTSKLKSPLYKVAFKTRSILWRYVPKNPDDIVSIADASDPTLTFTKQADKTFLSSRLVEMQEKTVRSIQFKKNNLVNPVAVAAPPSHSFKLLKEQTHTYLVSDMHINF